MHFGKKVTALAATIVFSISLTGRGSPQTQLGEEPAAAAVSWHYDPDESGMTFVTIHNDSNAEINTFREIEGSVSADGSAVLTIDLNSIDSANEARDTAYRDILFETAIFPPLTASAQVNMADFAELAIGERHTELLDLTIDLRGVEKRSEFYVTVTRLSEDRVLIENKAPLILSTSEFAMDNGLGSLRELAGISSITPSVTATISFVFERQGGDLASNLTPNPDD